MKHAFRSDYTERRSALTMITVSKPGDVRLDFTIQTLANLSVFVVFISYPEHNLQTPRALT